MKKTFIFLAFLLNFFIFQSKAETQEKEISNTETSKRVSLTQLIKFPGYSKMKKIDIYNRFLLIKPEDMPILVRTSKEENFYLQYLITSALDVMKEKLALKEDDEIFGRGKFHWPKDRRKPTKVSISYQSENFKLSSISIGFRRPTSTSHWCSAGISVHPKNFPAGIFVMDLKKDFFSQLEFYKSFSETRENDSTKNVNVFIYKFIERNVDLNLRFEARTDVSNVKDEYPTSFHDLIIERVSPECM